jgi:hypothetical protein
MVVSIELAIRSVCYRFRVPLLRDPQWATFWREIIANIATRNAELASKLEGLTVRDGWFEGHHMFVVADEPFGSDFDGAVEAAREAAWRIGQVRLTVERNLAS